MASIDKNGCVGDFLSSEQKNVLRLSNSSDILKCKIPKNINETIEKTKENFCNGLVKVNSYLRNCENINSYLRSCGRHYKKYYILAV